MLAKAAALPADEVIVDLEDGVAADMKDRARENLAGAAALGTLAIRINGVRTPWWQDDLAAVAAGLPRPPQSVYPHLRDLDGLARSCRRGRELGHLGRAAIHPDQLPVIEQAFLPTADEVERARATIERLGEGVGTLDGGAFVDAAMLGAAQQIVELAERHGVSGH